MTEQCKGPAVRVDNGSPTKRAFAQRWRAAATDPEASHPVEHTSADPLGVLARSRLVNLRDALSTTGSGTSTASDGCSARTSDAPARDRPATIDPLARRVAGRAALLFAIGMVTGLWSGIALSGKVAVAIPRLALAAHLNALMGGFWLLGLAFTLPMLGYSEKGKERLAKLSLVPTYGNWLVTLIASFVGVRGIAFTGEHANDVIAVLLLAVVVVPSLMATFAWAWGFRRAPSPR
jgi:hydroxylaminobenzene mutase